MQCNAAPLRQQRNNTLQLSTSSNLQNVTSLKQVLVNFSNLDTPLLKTHLRWQWFSGLALQWAENSVATLNKKHMAHLHMHNIYCKLNRLTLYSQIYWTLLVFCFCLFAFFMSAACEEIDSVLSYLLINLILLFHPLQWLSILHAVSGCVEGRRGFSDLGAQSKLYLAFTFSPSGNVSELFLLARRAYL